MEQSTLSQKTSDVCDAVSRDRSLDERAVMRAKFTAVLDVWRTKHD